jgi:hypothetical protein
MYRHARRLLLVLPLLAAAGCASARGVGSGAMSEEIGPATIPAVEREVMPILERHGYTILRTDRGQDRVMLETDWVLRPPYADEAATGVVDARSRIIITTRPRATTNSAGVQLAGVTMRMEIQHLRQGNENWSPAANPSRDAAVILRRMADAARLELQVKGMQGN